MVQLFKHQKRLKSPGNLFRVLFKVLFKILFKILFRVPLNQWCN